MKISRALLITSIIMAAGLISIYIVGTVLVSAQQNEFSSPDDLQIEDIIFSSKTGKLLSGWFINAKSTQGAILLLHSVRSDRREMIGRAKFLHAAGYSVMLIDMQAHGKSHGDKITFGYLESQDAEAALEFLQMRRSNQPIAVIGVSLGGAAALLGNVKHKADALIVEMVYPTLKHAVENRLNIHLGKLGHFLAPLLLIQIKPRLEFNPSELSPLSAISKTQAPLLIIAGEKDRHTPIEETKLLYQQANEPKEIWVLKEAKHQNLYEHAPDEYQRRVLGFLQQHL